MPTRRRVALDDQRVLQVLADPTRQAILGRLRRGPAAVGEIAEGLPVSRPAVSQHLKLMREAGLVSEERVGVRRVYRADIKGLVQLRRYLDALWDDVLQSLADDASRTR